MPPKRKINKRKVVAVNVDDVDQTEDPLPQAETYDDSETAGDDPADNVVTVTGDGEESTDNDIGAVPNRAKKPVVTQEKSKNKTPDNEGGTVINIALQEDISEEQELKIAAWVEDNEMLYNQTTIVFKNKAKKDRMFADFGATIGFSDSPDIQTMVYGKGKAPCSFTKVRASSSKVAKSTLDSALSEYLRKTAPETANMHKEMQDSLAALTQQRDHAAIWGESLAISARRLPFNLFHRFQMDSLALMNRYLGMAERGEDPDQMQSVFHASAADGTTSA
ncbi:unnamed protein product [Mytilus coruscus]|uniref:Uncharacterized protein n=1 Tax=Mytilus coruscus TaxID=42192 RepID=A0A6J8B5W1_MYTCO|nr:unnamed protein product [Mytilus coruscus]